MAYQVPGASAPHANVVASINGNHASVDFTGLPHYDSTEINPSSVELYISASAPTDFQSAVVVLNQARSLYLDHLTYNNGGGAPIYAHKVQDNVNVVTQPAMDGGALYTTMFNAIKTLYLAVRTSYVNHINNLKPNQTAGLYHVGIDTVDVLGAVPVINDEADLVVDMNNLKAQFNAHIVNTTGVHGAADGGNALTSPNAVLGDLDTSIDLVNEMKTNLNAHFATGGMVHTGAFGADTQNTIVASSVSYPAGLFDLANDIYTQYEAHRVSVTYHNVADGTNILAGVMTYPVTTIAELIDAAGFIQTKLNGHFRFAPLYSRALRVV